MGPYSVPGSCPSLSHTLGHSGTWGQTTPSQPGCLRAFSVPDLHLYACLALPTWERSSQPAGPVSVSALNQFSFLKFSTGVDETVIQREGYSAGPATVSLSTQGSVPIMLLIGAFKPGRPRCRRLHKGCRVRVQQHQLLQCSPIYLALPPTPQTRKSER